MSEIGKRWREILETSVQTVRDPSKIMETAQSTWESELFNKLGIILVTQSRSIGQNAWDLVLASDEARQAWVSGFTHFSVDYENNYETRETFGDKLLSAAIYYLFIGNPQDEVLGKVMKSPNPSDRLTQINKTLASKTFLGPMFRKYFDELHHYVRCTTEFQNKTDIMEDVFESFIAAIQISVDKATWEGKFMGPGFVSVNKFVHWFYTRRLSADEFDISGRKDFLTYMKEYFEKFYRITTGKTTQTVNEDGTKTYTSTLVYQPGHTEAYGHPFRDTTGRMITVIDRGTGEDEVRLDVRQTSEGFVFSTTEGPRSNIKDAKMKMFTSLKRFLKGGLTTNQELTEFDNYLTNGRTTYKILRNIIPDRTRYDQLVAIAQKMGFAPDTLDIDRTDFGTGYTSLIIWARLRDTDEKKTIHQWNIQPVEGQKQTNEHISSMIYQWIADQI